MQVGDVSKDTSSLAKRGRIAAPESFDVYGNAWIRPKTSIGLKARAQELSEDVKPQEQKGKATYNYVVE